MATMTLHLEIDAPDGPSALQLEQRLAHLNPTSVARDGYWRVEIHGTVDAVDEIEGVVGGWLRDICAPVTIVRLDGRPTVGARACASAQRARDGSGFRRQRGVLMPALPWWTIMSGGRRAPPHFISLSPTKSARAHKRRDACRRS